MLTLLLGRLMGAVGFLSLLLFGAVLYLAPDFAGARWLGAAAAVGLSGWVYIDFEALSRFAASRGGKEQFASTLLIVVGVAIAGLGIHLADRAPKRWDLTEGRLHSLDPQTEAVLRDVPAGTTMAMTGYFVGLGDARQEAQRARWSQLVDAMTATGTPIAIETVDPATEPLRARTDEVSSNATVLVTAQVEGQPLRVERLISPEEQDIANAVVRLAQDRKATVGFVRGHGERTPSQGGEEGLALFAAALREKGFSVAEIDTLREPELPAGLSLLVLAAPQVPLTAPEAERIAAWVEAGGSLLVALEPPLPGQPAPLSGLEEALAGWGLSARDDLVLDELMRQYVGDATAPLVDRFGLHQITDGLQVPIVLSTARTLVTTDVDPEAVTLFELAKSSEAAWGETTLDPGVPVAADESDHLGPVDLVLLAELTPEGQERGGMALLVGDVDWLTDGLLTGWGNRDFALRAVGHLARQEDLIKLPERERAGGGFEVDFLTQVFLGLGSVLLLPGACLLAGFGVLLWRRSL
jgi:hypothetical protein